MYIRTPKKYRGPQRRSIFPWRRIWVVLLMIGVIAGGIWVYRNRATIQPQVMRIAATAAVEMQGGISTLQAPPPTATADPAANLTQGNNAWSVGNVGEAIGFYTQIVDALPNDADLYYRVTLGTLTNGDERDALAYAERTITADPFSAYGWAARALALVENNRDQEAITSALQALDLDDENVTAMAFLALAYFGVDQDQTAFTWAERAINQDPDRFEGYYARGLIYENSLAYLNPDLAEADYRAAYDLALSQNPALLGDIAVGIARLQERVAFTNGTSDFTAAIATLEEVLQINPTNTSVLFRLGEIEYAGRGDFSRALNYYQSCLDIDQENTACVYRAGRAHNALGNSVEALELFSRLVDELGSTDAYHYYWAGQMQFALGDCALAADYWRQGYQYALTGPDANDSVIVPSYEALPDCANLNFSNPAPAVEATAADIG